MRRLAWIWFAGCIAWTISGMLSLRVHNWPRAELSLAVAMVFLFAGLLYRQQKR
jgi:hypothetical protein